MRALLLTLICLPLYTLGQYGFEKIHLQSSEASRVYRTLKSDNSINFLTTDSTIFEWSTTSNALTTKRKPTGIFYPFNFPSSETVYGGENFFLLNIQTKQLYRVSPLHRLIDSIEIKISKKYIFSAHSYRSSQPIGIDESLNFIFLRSSPAEINLTNEKRWVTSTRKAFNTEGIISIYDLKTGEFIKAIGKYPEEYGENLVKTAHLEYTFDYDPRNHNLYVSFAGSGKILKYNAQTETSNWILSNGNFIDDESVNYFTPDPKQFFNRRSLVIEKDMYEDVFSINDSTIARIYKKGVIDTISRKGRFYQYSDPKKQLCPLPQIQSKLSKAYLYKPGFIQIIEKGILVKEIECPRNIKDFLYKSGNILYFSAYLEKGENYFYKLTLEGLVFNKL